MRTQIIAPFTRHALSLIAVALAVKAFAAGGADASKAANGAYVDGYISALSAAGVQIKVVERSTSSDSVRGWRDLIAPTFGLILNHETATRVVFEDLSSKQSCALLVFSTPKSLNQSFPVFSSLRIEGILRSKAHTYYYAAASPEVFVVLLSEQKPLIDTRTQAALVDSLYPRPAHQPPAKP